MEITGIFLCVLVVGVACNPLERSGSDPQDDAPHDFSIRDIGWHLVAHSERGTISVNVEVRNHDDCQIRWYMLEPGSLESEYIEIPLTSSGPYSVYTQRYWSKDRQYIGGKLTLRYVPPVDQLYIILEVSAANYGPTLKYKFTAAISNNFYVPRESQKVTTLEPMHYPTPTYTHKNEDQVSFSFQTRGPKVARVQVQRAVASGNAEEIYADVVDIDDTKEDRVSLKDREMADDVYLTDTILVVDKKDDSYIYRVTLYSDDAVLEYFILYMQEGITSIFTGPHLMIETCSGTPVTSSHSGDITIELSMYSADCIRCIAASPGGVSMELSRDSLPIGSGNSHVVFWYRKQPDIGVMSFVIYEHLYTYMYQTFSYQGHYACSATSDGHTISKSFDITFI